ncbi:MAG TPA: glycosyltransferase family 2 protein [Acidimicrobiales bacterium]|nr:glycosyltransferase family 2 protein [Acidimicrobiales bacterium]
MTETVDVVVLTWDDEDDMRGAVASANSSTGVDVSVVVVDNGSARPVTVPDTGAVTVLRNPGNLGVAAGRNRGVAAGSSPFVCLLDSDARLRPNCLSLLLGPLERDPTVAMTVPVFSGLPPEASAGRAPGLLRKVARLLGITNVYGGTGDRSMPSWEVEAAIGACQLVRREAFDEVGGLDESFFYGPEDVDFCLRLRGRGWRILQVGDARCDHAPRRTSRAVFSRRGVAHAWAVSRYLWRHRWVRPPNRL